MALRPRQTMSSAENPVQPAQPASQASDQRTSSGPFSLSLGGPKFKSTGSSLSHRPLASLNGHKRPHSSLHGSDDEDDEPEPQARLVSGFDHAAGGAISFGEPQAQKGPLVIAPLRNRDWRDESRRRRKARSSSADDGEQNGNIKGGSAPRTRELEVVNGTPQPYGLSFVTKADERRTDAEVDGNEASVETSVEASNDLKEKTVEELALEALTSGKASRKSNLVLPLVDDAADTDSTPLVSRGLTSGVSEDVAFRTDVSSRPDSASLADYAVVPVEEFGAALLRGMGWKEGDVVGKRKDVVSKPRVVERRPALLGIGAKEMPGGVGDELGAWGKGAAAGNRKHRRVDKVYSPVVLKNAKTGEMLTEDELKGKVEEDQKRKAEDDWRQRRDRNLRLDSERKGRRGGGRDRGRLSRDGDLADDIDDRDSRNSGRDQRHHRQDRHRAGLSPYALDEPRSLSEGDKRARSSRRGDGDRHRRRRDEYGDDDDYDSRGSHQRRPDRAAHHDYDPDYDSVPSSPTTTKRNYRDGDVDKHGDRLRTRDRDRDRDGTRERNRDRSKERARPRDRDRDQDRERTRDETRERAAPRDSPPRRGRPSIRSSIRSSKRQG